MSGFFGIVRTDGMSAEPRFLDAIAEHLQFRGPDGTRTWAQGGLGASFAYLATGTRHQARSQPVQLGERYTLLGEVRLDAREELIRELSEIIDAPSEGASDEELLLLAWIRWGEGALVKLLGDYSFAIWDATQQTLFCARDFCGARPLFYAFREGVFSYSNMLNALRFAPGVSDNLDEAYVREFLRTGLCSDPTRTVWRDIRRLPAGHRLILSAGQVRLQRFLKLPIEEPLRFKQSSEYLENYKELLGHAVGDRLPEGKVSFSLSGGLDSGSVCATAASIAKAAGNFQAQKAFTISWRPLFGDPEPEFAQLTAEHLGLAHEILEENSIQPNESGAAGAPEPNSECFFDRDRRFRKTISNHARVVLSGDGGDDILSGQSWPYLEFLYGRHEWAEMVSSFGGYLVSRRRFPPLRGGFRSRFRQWAGPKHNKAPQSPAWLKEGFVERGPTEPEAGFQDRLQLEEHPLHPVAYRALHGGYWASVHETEDAGCTGVLLETRAPLLDLRILRFLLRVPPVPWCINKELCRQAMKGGLPDRVLVRQKTPLMGDPLEVCWRRGWRPHPEKKPPKMLHEFVKWDSWLATSEDAKGYFPYEYLYPLCFSMWLKDIEKDRGIQ